MLRNVEINKEVKDIFVEGHKDAEQELLRYQYK
jgi:hypothetical protein